MIRFLFYAFTFIRGRNDWVRLVLKGHASWALNWRLLNPPGIWWRRLQPLRFLRLMRSCGDSLLRSLGSSIRMFIPSSRLVRRRSTCILIIIWRISFCGRWPIMSRLPPCIVAHLRVMSMLPILLLAKSRKHLTTSNKRYKRIIIVNRLKINPIISR